MRKICISIFVILFGSTVFAGEWTGTGKIKSIYPKPQRNGIYFTHDNMKGGDCTTSVPGYYFLDANQSLFKETYSLLMAAYVSGKGVNLFVGACQEGHVYPKIVEMTAN